MAAQPMVAVRVQTVRIMVSEPRNLKGNLFGTIISDCGGHQLPVKLPKPVTGKRLTSDLTELSPQHEQAGFKPLSQHNAVAVSAALTAENLNPFEYIFTGNLTPD